MLLLPQLEELNKAETSFPKISLTIYIVYCFISLALAISAQLLLTNKKPQDSLQNKISLVLKNIVEFIASSKVMYFILGILIITMYCFNNKPMFISILVYLIAVIILANNQAKLQKLIDKLFNKNQSNSNSSVGFVVGVESNNVYKAQLYNNIDVDLFDSVIYKSKTKSNCEFRGIVIDRKVTNDTTTINILETEVNREKIDIGVNEVVKTKQENSNKIVGLVEVNTDVAEIYFRYIPKMPIEIGEVISIDIKGKEVIYQITNGKVNAESLDKLNTNGFIIGKAIQLGVWNEESNKFERYGWVPEYNTPVCLFNKDVTVMESLDADTIGCVPNTNYQIKFDYEEGIRHHLAIVGVTGCGKSVLTRKIIRDIIRNGTKVIAVDFTNEYINKFKYLKPKVLFQDKDIKENLYHTMNDYMLEMSK